MGHDGVMTTTLYERIGGEQAVARAVDSLYDRVLADERLAPFFEGADLDALRRMQRQLFAAALGATDVVDERRPLGDVHRGRGIRPVDLSHFMEHLVEGLRAAGLDADELDEAATRLAIVAQEVSGGVGEDG